MVDGSRPISAGLVVGAVKADGAVAGPSAHAKPAASAPPASVTIVAHRIRLLLLFIFMFHPRPRRRGDADDPSENVRLAAPGLHSCGIIMCPALGHNGANMPSIEIKSVLAVALVAIALLPAGVARAGAEDIGPMASGAPASGSMGNPRSVDAAGMANVPCYFEGSSILQFDLNAGPSRAQDPAQAAAAQRINDAMTDNSCDLLPFCGGSTGSGGRGSGGRGSGWSYGVNTYGNGGW